MTIGDLVRTDVVTTRPETTIDSVAKQLRDENVGSVVVERDGAPVGIVTDRDVAVRVVAEGTSPGDARVEDVMTEDPETVEMDAGVFEVTQAMRNAEARRMPVVEGGDLAGIITLDDLNRLLVDELGNLADVVAAESPPY